MTGAVLSFQRELIDASESRRKRKDIEIFSESLSEYTGFDFSNIADDFNDELNGLLSYLQTRRLELQSTGLSKNEVLTFLTLNMISSFSLWLGFNRAKEYPKTPKEVAEDNPKKGNSSKTPNREVKSNYKSSVVIPTNLTDLDNGRLTQLRNLIMSLSSWENLSGLWIIGRIPEQAATILGEFENLEIMNVDEDKGPAKARNIGIEKALAKGMDLLVFMDDDVVSPINETFKSVCNNAVRSRVIYSPKIESYSSTCFDLFHDLDGTLNGVYESDTEHKCLVYGTTCVMIAPASVFKNGLRFDEDFPLAAGEDIDFCIRAKAKGIEVIPADGLIVKHDFGYNESNDSLTRFVSRFVRYGEGNRLIKSRQPEYFDALAHSERRPTLGPRKKASIIPKTVAELSKIVERCLD